MSTSAKYEVVTVKNVDVMVDISLLNKSDDMFFNATEIAKQFGKQVSDFLRLESTKEYINEILQDSGTGNSRFKNSTKVENIHLENLVRITKGGKYQGTWLHKELAFEFFGWCSASFRRSMHKWTEQRLNEEHLFQEHRLSLKTGFLPLTKAIQHAHTESKSYHYSNECNLINRLVTGMDSKQFKNLHGVQTVRDALTAAQVCLMDKLQAHNACLIELGFDYETRKEKLCAYAENFLVA